MGKKKAGSRMVVVYVKHPGPDDENGIPIADAETVDLDGFRCLSGHLFFGDDHWLNGRAIRIALDEVAYLVEFESVKEYEKAISRFRTEQLPPGFSAYTKRDGERRAAKD